MSFIIYAKNLPSGATFWKPAIYVGTKVYAPDEYLVPEAGWACPMTAASGGSFVDFRCITYDAGYTKLQHRDKLGVLVKNGLEYVYDWLMDNFGAVGLPAPEFKDLSVSYRKS